MIHPAAKFAFERAVHEYGRWRAVEEPARSPAAAWWWSPAMAVRCEREAMPVECAHALALPPGATYADAAQVMLSALAVQTALPWPEGFPRRYQPAPIEQAVS